MLHVPTIDKASFRIHCRAYRSALDPGTYAELSRAVCERTLQIPELQRARTVHVYWPLVARNEIDTRPLIAAFLEAGKQVALPLVHTFGRPTGEPRMEQRLFDPAVPLAVNDWGLEEPVSSQSVPKGMLDAVIVPALGAGRNGHRVGHGFGYYDEFLKDMRAITICPVYHKCLADIVPFEEHDVRMDVIVTEQESLRTGRHS